MKGSCGCDTEFSFDDTWDCDKTNLFALGFDSLAVRAHGCTQRLRQSQHFIEWDGPRLQRLGGIVWQIYFNEEHIDFYSMWLASSNTTPDRAR